MSFSAWEEVRVADAIISSNTGLDAIKRAPIVEEDTGVKCLRIQDISQFKEFKSWGFCKVEEKNYEKFRLKKGDIIVARTGATIGVNRIIKSDLKAVYNNGLIRIKCDTKVVDNRYLYYNMQGDKYKGHIDAISGGTSTQPNMKMNALLDFQICLPSLLEQEAIADTLSCLDDKIELNNRINKTLEEMAQAIFKNRFVNFEPFQDSEFEDSELGRIPRGWRVGTVGDFIKFNYGKALPSKNRKAGTIKVYSSAGHTDFHNEALVSESGIIVGRKGTIGTVYFEPNRFFCIDTAYYIAADDCSNALFYTFQLLKYLKLSQYNEDSAVPGLNRNTVYAIKIIIPPENVVSNLNEMFQTLQKQITANNEQNQSLTNIRDTLLPKLMSGEIRVPIEEV